jgi:L-iditol 2-dehydrogenase
MKSVRFHGIGDVRLDEVESRMPGPGEVLLKPEAVGICGTDIHIIDGEFVSRPPMALGHEISARVVELGAGVNFLKLDQLVTIEPHLYCGACFNCQSGTPHMCKNRKAPGVHLDGGMQELLTLPATLAYELPEGVEPWLGALTEPVACCVHGMDRLQPLSGNPIAIFGAGPIGAILIALARKAGLGPIVALDPRESRRNLALRFGADIALDPTAVDLEDATMDITRGVGFPYVIDATGAPGVLEAAVSATSRAGRVLLLGVAAQNQRASLSPYDIYARELTILGTALNPFTHRRAANLLPSLGLERLSRGEFPIESFQDALAAQREGLFDKTFLMPQNTKGKTT